MLKNYINAEICPVILGQDGEKLFLRIISERCGGGVRDRKSAMVTAIHQTPRAQRKGKNTRMIACSRQSADLARTEAHLPVIRSETARCFADPRIVTSLVYFIVPHSASIVRRLCTPTNTNGPAPLRRATHLRAYPHIAPFRITHFPLFLLRIDRVFSV